RVRGQGLAVVGANHWNQAERVDRPEVRAVAGALGFGIDLDKVCIGAGLVEGDAGGHRAGQRGEVDIHMRPPLLFVLFRTIIPEPLLASRSFLRNGTKRIIAAGTEAARTPTRL